MSIGVKSVFKYIFTGIIIFFLIGMFILNVPVFKDVFDQNVSAQKFEYNNTKKIFSDIENSFRENVKYHNNLVDMYGVYQRILDRNIVGNFEYVADENGVLHIINEQMLNVLQFVEEMKELKTIVEQKGIPLLYLQAPNREFNNRRGIMEEFNSASNTMDILVKELSSLDISVFDSREKFIANENELDFSLADVFFHTDLHMQTDAEIWMIDQFMDYFENETGLYIDDSLCVRDESLFTKQSYEFLGNLGRTNGSYYVGKDMFDMYFPNFDTSFDYIVPYNEVENRTGKFEDILMNGYTNMDVDKYTYFVTNYMRFTKPYYTFVNNKQENVKLLVITDSIAYRGLAYLALMINKLTIVDPRYFNGFDYINLALEENDYDAVIVIQGSYLVQYPLITN